MKFIVDTKFLSLGVPHLTTHLSLRSVYSLIRIDEFLVVPTRLSVPHPHSPFWEIRVSSEWPGQALCHTMPTFIKSLTVGQNQGSQRPVWPCSVELPAEQ